MNSPTILRKSARLMVVLAVLLGVEVNTAAAQNFLTVLQDAAELAPISEEATSAFPVSNSSDAVEIFRERYPNGEVRIEREVTLDAAGNYVNHGSWKMWDPTGLMIADGHYDMGKKVGNWTRILGRKDTAILRQAPFNQFKAPFTSNVTFNNDKMNGDWLIIDAEQRKVSQISLADGIRHGMAITWLPNGNVLRQSQYDNGVPVGDVVQANSSTGKLERSATYLEGRRISSNVEYYSRAKRQKKTEEMFLAPKTVQKSSDDFWNTTFATYGQEGEPLRHGMAKGWYQNGQLQSEGQYEYNKRIGHFRFWHSNGQISAEGTFRGDQYAGVWVWWHENGQKAIVGRYDSGRYVGEWRWWNEIGQLSNRQTYDGTADIAPADVDRTTQHDVPELRLTK